MSRLLEPYQKMTFWLRVRWIINKRPSTITNLVSTCTNWMHIKIWLIKSTDCARIGAKTIILCIVYPKRRHSIFLSSTVSMKVFRGFLKYYALMYIKKCFCHIMFAFFINLCQRKNGINYLYFWVRNGAKCEHYVHDIMHGWNPTIYI